MNLNVTTTDLDGVLILQPRRFQDPRGYFEEVWSEREFLSAVGSVKFVQDNHSSSAKAGTLRGLHFQAPPHAQDKLVRCTQGAIFDVAVDIRVGSKTYGQWVGVELTPQNGKQLFIPKGFLHGFVTLTDQSDIEYKCSDYYHAPSDGSVLWDSLDIAWPLQGQPILSQKDADATPMAAFHSPFHFGSVT